MACGLSSGMILALQSTVMAIFLSYFNELLMRTVKLGPKKIILNEWSTGNTLRQAPNWGYAIGLSQKGHPISRSESY